MRGATPSVFGLLVFSVSVGACATSEEPTQILPGATGGAASGSGGESESGAPAGSGGQSPSTGGASFGTGGANLGTGGRSSGTGGTFGGGGSGGSGTSTGGVLGTGGNTCFLGICPATGGASGTGGTSSASDGGDAHKLECNQKLCVDPVFDCILQGCPDAICQIPFCVIP